VRNLSPVKGSGYSWQEAFETDDPGEAERGCARIGADFRMAGGRRAARQPGARRDGRAPGDGEEVWFNQADGFHPSALLPESMRGAGGGRERGPLPAERHYGDGEPIERESLDHIRAVLRGRDHPAPLAGGRRAGDRQSADRPRPLPFEGPRRSRSR
jgi:hypothetical protein